MYLDRPVSDVIGTLSARVAGAPLLQRKYLAVPSRTRACDRLMKGLALFAVRFLHFLLYLSAHTKEHDR